MTFLNSSEYELPLEHLLVLLLFGGVTTKKGHIRDAERFFSCHTYDTSMKIVVAKPGIIIDVVCSYFYDKKS